MQTKWVYILRTQNKKVTNSMTVILAYVYDLELNKLKNKIHKLKEVVFTFF